MKCVPAMTFNAVKASYSYAEDVLDVDDDVQPACNCKTSVCFKLFC